MKKRKLSNKHILISAVIVLVIILSYFLIQTNNQKDYDIIQIDDSNIKITESGEKYIIDPSKIRSGGPPKGGIGIDIGIPALNNKNIKFVSVDEADKWIQDDELVLVLEYKGVKRVYPLQIMVWHEIANDKIKGYPIAITYCPLCGSGIAYEGKVKFNDEFVETEFGTSGKLYNSNQTSPYISSIPARPLILQLHMDLQGQESSLQSLVTDSYHKLL